jgi:hypothetical protein
MYPASERKSIFLFMSISSVDRVGRQAPNGSSQSDGNVRYDIRLYIRLSTRESGRSQFPSPTTKYDDGRDRQQRVGKRDCDVDAPWTHP